MDACLGAASCAAIWVWRRWPVGVALVALVTGILSLSSGWAGYVAVCNAGIRRARASPWAMAVLHGAGFIPYYLLWIIRYPLWAVLAVSATENAAMVILGMYIRADRRSCPRCASGRSRRRRRCGCWPTRHGTRSGPGSRPRCTTCWLTGCR